jgi:hypothetical protein
MGFENQFQQYFINIVVVRFSSEGIEVKTTDVPQVTNKLVLSTHHHKCELN